MNKPDILVIDDEPHNLRALKLDLEDSGYTVITAEDGIDGWEQLHKHLDGLKVILLDRMMPNMDGMEFMKKFKQDENVSNIPVIMQTAAAQKEQVVQGIEAGVYYYLTKPYEKEMMLSIVQAAITEFRQHTRLREDAQVFKSKLNLVKDCHFELSKIEEVDPLATFLAQFSPRPEDAVFGIAQMLINALEHGNLGITYDEKTALNNNGSWLEEVKRRQYLPENANKKVHIKYTRGDKDIALVIRDEGQGFKWHDYMEISPERATHSNGRGIALSRLISFSALDYVGCGNEVHCRILLN